MPKNIYTTKGGTLVPGVTTIINQLDKPNLVQWAWKLGKEGKDWKAERDSAGDIGTLVHELVLAHLSGEVVLLSDKDDVVKKCFEKFASWQVGTPFNIELVEEPLVSEVYKFGGQPDLVYDYGGKLVVCDIKTSNGIYDSYWLQLAAYGILLSAVKGLRIHGYQVLWLPKDNRFGCPIRTDLRKEKKIFKHLLGIYQLRRAE